MYHNGSYSGWRSSGHREITVLSSRFWGRKNFHAPYAASSHPPNPYHHRITRPSLVFFACLVAAFLARRSPVRFLALPGMLSLLGLYVLKLILK